VKLCQPEHLSGKFWHLTSAFTHFYTQLEVAISSDQFQTVPVEAEA
jgi:hypothetical protein